FQNITEYNDYKESAKLQKRRDVLKLSLEKSFLYKEEDKYFFTPKGSVIIESIKNHLISEFNEDHPINIYLPSNTDYKSAFKALDKAIESKTLSYKVLPKMVMSEITVANELINNPTPVLISKLYMQNGKELMNSADFIEKLIDVCGYITKQDINVNIRCTDLENKIVKTVSTLFQKRIISHTKVLSNKVNGIAEIEFNVRDSVGKEWILCRCFIPNVTDERVTYRDNQNQNQSAVEIGVYFDIISIFAYLVEEFEYDMPFKFKPVQAVCIPKSNDQLDFATSVNNHLLNNNFRTIIDNRSLSLQSKIYDAEKKKIPFIFIIGPKEESNNAVSIRKRNVEIGLMSNENLINFINENKEKR
ncbi:hypothetical protein KC678_00775, partial [Candidatus Dojkabacteria bacterium]|nr:hypothetical protein [Candidatus Dojkabacteria bacterium]